MSDGGVGLSGEQIAWHTVSREIEDQLLRGPFSGDIVLHCLNGVVQSYHVNQKRKPGELRDDQQRQVSEPRDGNERRKK